MADVKVGTTANDGTGDPLREAFIKLNENDQAHATSIATERTDRINAVRDAGLMSLVNVSGKNVITAELTPALKAGGATIAGASTIELIPAETSDGPVMLNIDGGGNVEVRDVAGAPVKVGALVAGRSYLLRRRGSSWRIIAGEITSVELREEAIARTDAIAEAAVAEENIWPGDDVVIVRAANGSALVTESDGMTRGTFSADDIMPGKTQEILRSGEGDAIRNRVLDDGWPGDAGDVLVQGANGVALAYDGKGRLHGTIASTISGWPGDYVTENSVDARGVVLDGFDVRDGSDYGLGLDVSGWPGDHIIIVDRARDGMALAGYDKRDGSRWPAVVTGAAAAAVQFVDPGFFGDAWGAVSDAQGTIKFMSRAWDGEVIGFEQRLGKVLADTGTVATGILAIGGGDIGIERAQRACPWHVLDESLEYGGAKNAAEAAGAAYLAVEGAAYRARPTTIALAEVIGSTVAADVQPGATRRERLIERVEAAATALVAWNKSLVVDRIKMDLLDGAPGTLELTADLHYAAVGNDLRIAAAEATGQALLPRLIVNQGFGTRTDGTSPVILAEGRLDWNHFSLGFVVPTPLYPFPLVAGTPATLTTEGALMVSEIEALAMAEVTAGREWYAPSLEEAHLSGSTITARFATMNGLVLRDPANHGLDLRGVTNGATITDVSASGSFVTITLSAAPEGTLTLDHAFGRTGDPGDGFAANRSSLTDSWSAQSRAVPDATLYRHARSGRTNVQ